MLDQGYLYIWNDVESKSIISSGIKFSDFVPDFNDKGGVILLRHDFSEPRHDSLSALCYVNARDVKNLLSADIYSWGDFYWANFSTENFPTLSEDEISELHYFTDNAMPMKSARVSSLCNDFIVAAHDDGWYVRAFYSSWKSVCRLLDRKAPELTNEQREILLKGGSGFWVQNGSVYLEDKTFNVDEVINRNIRKHENS